MIGEMVVVGASLVGCVTCWVALARHKLNIELQKHKITTDYEYTKPAPEPAPPRKEPSPAQQALDAQKKSLDALLERRESLEKHINDLRYKVGNNPEKQYDVWRLQTMKALEDARTEQQELVLEETGLLEMMKEANHDASQKPIRIDPGGPLAERVADPGELHDAELHDEETSRESAA